MEYKRLFDNHVSLTLEEISDKINKIFDDNFEVYEEKDAIKKWNSFPVIFLEDDNVKRKFLDLVIYIDELFLDDAKKVSLITSLAGMVEISKIPITKFTNGDLFTLLSYLEDVKLDEIKNKLNIFYNSDLLKVIRVKSLDMTERIFIMKYIDALYQKNNVDTKTDKNKTVNFIKEMIQVLAASTHDELMDKSGYNSYIEAKEEKQKEKK